MSAAKISAMMHKLGGESEINRLVDSFYDKVFDDYRINRIFNADDAEQRSALKSVVCAALSGAHCTDDRFIELLDDYFLHAFARNKRNSFVNGSDFNFLGMVADQDQPNPNPLCENHKYLLKFLPEDMHYDAAMEGLESAMRELSIETSLVQDTLALVESVRDKALGR